MKKWEELTEYEKKNHYSYQKALERIHTAKVRNSKELFLDSLNLREIPSEIEILPDLRVLFLFDNMITDLSPIKNLKKLKELNFNRNHVVDLSPIAGLTSLKSISAVDNKITSLRPLERQLIDNISQSYSTWNTYGDSMYFNGCPIVDPPTAIARQGPKAILEYWKEIDKAAQKQYEGRLLIVGEGKVGKTSLLYKLKDPNCRLDPEEPQTHGINIWRDWRFEVPDDPEFEYNASVWDFGGQDVQHLTHQYFLTPNTVYVLVVNKRGSNASDERVQLDYWFRIISTLGRHRGVKARVLVVHNIFSGDGTTHGVDLSSFKAKYEDSLELSLHRVNLFEGKGALQDLRNSIQEELLNLTGIGSKVPASWPDIRRELGEMREKRRISFGTYASICEKYGLDEESSQLLLSRYLSRLGELLHYEHGGLLFDNLLLDIDWITTTVYGITQNQDIIDRNGSFSRQEVVNVWKSQGITNRTDHELMLQLLQADAFELCWKEEGKDRYMTPSLFTVKAPSAEEVRTDIGMRYSTSYLPKGLLGQLIVRLHRYAEVDHYWRYGIFLSHNSCRARVHQPPGEHYIDIAVEGNAPDHYALLSIIQQELETVHQRTFSRIQFDLKIPCPCERCRSKDWEQDYFPRELLEKLQHSGDPIVICKNQKQTNINLLLKGFQNQNQPSIMGFLDQIRQLVGRNRTQEALELIDKRFPSNDISVLLRDYSELQSNRISGILSSDEERRISNQINIRLLNLAGSLEKTTSTTQQRQTIEEQLPEIRQQLDRIEATGQDTNDKVTLLGHMVKHVLMDIDEVKGDLFADRKEQRAFMNKLEEKVEALPAAEQPGEDWYDKPAKQKIKISLPLLPFVKYEREMDLSEATIPKTWAAFKNWFVV